MLYRIMSACSADVLSLATVAECLPLTESLSTQTRWARANCQDLRTFRPENTAIVNGVFK